MRDIGILVWVGLLIVGVVGSMISSLRRQAQTQGSQRPLRPGPGRASPWVQPTVAQPPPPAAPPQRVPTRVSAQGLSTRVSAQGLSTRVRPQPVEAGSQTTSPRAQSPSPRAQSRGEGTTVARGLAKGFFRDRRSLVRAVIAAEVLGKPRALGDEYFPR
jgi:hypothetical protein